ncbi:MAG: homoserine dehydrogenase [Deltaproteobacteria bacterium]|nr:homoserine dehydrogenase [Deltaproteobacteria bacterium]MBW2047137.1 homoserine dehydrogenase [Deltaproteobacteria bacterium]MBW2109942.1 homoserine dehydrogenase [Deltaproteobacteria bacterium]MBW2351835.1 homoserine dehydrogenase [Deltaproteobacteria bacterium]HDZ91503.1 homoserine dehydrogenase [Deltaproteobacteria bacterium]
MLKINVGIIGFGTVGAGTFEVLTTNRKLIRDRIGAEVVVKRIADLDIESDRGIPVRPAREILTMDAMDLIDDPEIDLVVELVGGLDRAREFILRAMEKGKHVVTANKALLAEHGALLYRSAREHGVGLAFEASVGGGIPIIGALKNGLSGNRIQTCVGILNGTSNYILTKMTQEGLPFDRAVDQAVHLGFAEDPPTLDVDGTDAAHKLAIIISIAFGSPVSFNRIYREGIVAVTPDDIRYADEFGYRVKLLAIAKDLGDKIEARVHSAMISRDHILANVNEAFNAIYIEGDFVGPNLYYGLGAGRRPTGSAVVSDIIGLAREIKAGARELTPPLGHALPREEGIEIQAIEDLITPYYFRFSAVDTPGVLSRIAGILSEHRISISSVIQKGRKSEGPVSIVMLTHEARESAAQKAISAIDKLDVVTDKTVVIRVEGNSL